MKRVGITQRIDSIELHQEIRDALDQRWSLFCNSCHLLPLLIPNSLPIATMLMENFSLDGIILSGGNSLHKYGGDAPERDGVERFLLQYAINHRIPVLGVCRGMQLIQDFFGVSLQRILNHSGKPHAILQNDQLLEVNSYHDYGAKSTTADLQVLAKSEDGVIEMIQHKTYPITGIMWHPERRDPFHLRDQQLFTQIFGG